MNGQTARLAVAFAAAAFGPALHAETLIKIPRENGALHQEFRNLLADKIKAFRGGVGRMEIPGTDDGTRCLANFYVNTDTTFVTLEIDDDAFYQEFYIDHPTQSFRNVLFQHLIMNDEGTALKVVKRDGDYTIQTDGERLVLSVRNPGEKEGHSCTFDLDAARMYEGETE